MKCPRCHVGLVKGEALRNTLATALPDFAGDVHDSTGQTLSYSGPAILCDVWKCPNCGYSRTIGMPRLPKESQQDER